HAQTIARRLRIADRDVSLDAHHLEHLVESLRRDLGLVLDELARLAALCSDGRDGRRRPIGLPTQRYPYARLAAADAEDAGTRFVQHLDVDALLVDAQLRKRIVYSVFDGLARGLYCGLTACLDV